MSTSRIAEQVREAFAAQRPLRLKAAGTWMSAGRPARTAETLSLGDDRGIVEYVPGDLTLTARAGTPLSEISAATHAHNQWLPLDPWGGDQGTIGATVSTASAGPHSFAMGLPRDVVLGLEFVNGMGQIIRSGGRVVKNVAGFDLTRLIVGSWGTLGVITEVTVRLRARPQHTRSLALPIATSAETLNELATRLRALPFTPLASEVISDALAAHLGFAAQPLLLLRVAGNDKAIRGQLDALRKFGAEPRDMSEDVWEKLRAADASSAGRDAATWRWSRLPALFGHVWQAAERVARDMDNAFVHGNPARGVVRVIARSLDGAALARAATSFDGTINVERLPGDAWRGVPGHDAQDPISRAIRAKFDPAAILNAGILGEAA
jgi:glycolate oxidase FAD binding subunit